MGVRSFYEKAGRLITSNTLHWLVWNIAHRLIPYNVAPQWVCLNWFRYIFTYARKDMLMLYLDTIFQDSSTYYVYILTYWHMYLRIHMTLAVAIVCCSISSCSPLCWMVWTNTNPLLSGLWCMQPILNCLCFIAGVYLLSDPSWFMPRTVGYYCWLCPSTQYQPTGASDLPHWLLILLGCAFNLIILRYS